MSGRLLLLSYHFGPGCATGGLRWNGLAPHLVAAGWEVEVISGAPFGSGRPYEFAAGVRVTPVPTPTWFGEAVRGIGTLKRRLRRQDAGSPAADSAGIAVPANGGNQSPDLYSRIMGNVGALSRWSADLGWGRHAVRAGLALARRSPFSAVLVSSPPHATQLAGMRLGRALRIPYVCDFRDPWMFGDWDAADASLVDLWLGRAAQRRVLPRAAGAVFNTGWARQAALAYLPSLETRSVAIPNGYDARGEIGRPDPERFRVSFVGWLYDFMDPDPVLAACGRLRQRIGPGQLHVEFVGTAEAHLGVSLHQRARAHGLEDCFEHQPRVSREEALRRQDRSAVQIVFDTPGPLRVPAKFYDAVQGYGDLLLIGQPSSALGDAGREVGFPVCRSDDPAAIDQVLARAYSRWQAGEYRAPLDVSGVFARDRAARLMIDVLEGLAAGQAR